MYCIKRNHKLKLHVLMLTATPNLRFSSKNNTPKPYLNLPEPPVPSLISKNTGRFDFLVTFFLSFESLVEDQLLSTLLK